MKANLMKSFLKGATVLVAVFGISSVMSSCSNEEEVAIEGKTRAATIITENVTSNTTWSGEIELAKKIAVTNGATLTIQAGTKIYGQATGNPNDATALIITKGAKINAIGTATNPIVMSAKNGQVGGWGGLVILGNAPINQTATQYIEGIVEGSLPGVDTSYGGNDSNDNSGTLRYVRVEYAGATIGENNELNSFTFGGVGAGTTIDHCQAYFGDDDGFEFFGGCVNAQYLVATGTTDDSFDFDFGYTGKIQFAVSTVASSRLTSDPNGIECDNDKAGSSATPYTHPVLSNFTLIGSTTGTSLKSAANFRRNCQFTLVNSILYGFPTGILCQTTNSNVFKNNIVNAISTTYSGITADATNTTAANVAAIGLTNAWGTYKNQTNLRPNATPAIDSADFSMLDSWFTSTDYVGAIAPTSAGANWLMVGTWVR